MIENILKDSKKRMEKSVEAFKNELSKLRTGRAHPSIIEHVQVNYYGSAMPLNQVANIAVENARTLTVTPWEKTMIAEIEKAIIAANLGLNPNTAGMIIRIPLPPLTEERRRSLGKIVRDEAEKARVAVRNTRRDANQEFKNMLKEKQINEDEERRSETQMQKMTDELVAQIDTFSAQKEKDLMEI